jgi:major vault protein
MDVLAQARTLAADRQLAVDNKALTARVGAFKDEMGAMAPELIATLKTVGAQYASAELTKNLSPLAILGGTSVAEVLERLLKSLPVGLQSAGGSEAPKPLPTKK